MSFLSNLLQPETESSVRAKIFGIASACKLAVTNWIVGDVSQQILETIVSAAFAYASGISKIIRGHISLDTSVDPGDVDTYDSTNETMDPEYGMLSALGENVFGTQRPDDTFATCSFQIDNAGPSARDIMPESLVFTKTAGTDNPTYTNVADDSVYTNPNGSVTVAAGTSVTIPIQCQLKGLIGAAEAGAIDLTTTVNGLSGTNTTAAVGTVRMTADAFRTLCRQAAGRLSFATPEDAYFFLATHNLDGTLLQNENEDNVAISRVDIAGDPSYGTETVYYASPSGAAIAIDVTAANNNIQMAAFAVADCITFTGLAAVPQTVTVAGTARVRRRQGTSDVALAAEVAAGLAAGVIAGFPTIPVGGFDRGVTYGYIYVRDLEAYARSGALTAYDVQVTTPSSTVQLTEGHVAVPSTSAGSWTVTVAP
jgi:hypothetical protein